MSVFGSGDFASAEVAARKNNLVAWYEHPTGGHVAALDAPAEFVADLTRLHPPNRTGPMTNTHTVVLLAAAGWAHGCGSA